jgi:hypothetical protein
MGDLAEAFKDVEPEQLKEFCRGLLKDESTSTVEEQEHSDAENGTTPPESTQFVFVGAHDQSWPKAHGTSRREQQIAARKGASGA